MWVETDELQFVKKVNEDTFEVVEITAIYDDKEYIVQHVSVDFNQLSESKLKSAIDGFYDSLEEVKVTYAENWKQIVAECYAEQEPYSQDDFICKQNMDLQNHLKETYGINTEITFSFD